jgi:hypothetical protein
LQGQKDWQAQQPSHLHTCNADEARQILEAKNNAERQPVLNLQGLLLTCADLARRFADSVRTPYLYEYHGN